MVEDSQETTHFGFQTVAKEQKADMVAHVFHSVAAKYDVMNQLQTQQHNITTVSQKLDGTRIPKKASRSGSGSAATIGICW